MTTSNTKLAREQKDVLPDWRAYAQKRGIEIMDNEKTVIVFKEFANTVEFALSVASPNEKKFRRKVGQYFALSRFLDGYTVKMDRFDFYAWKDEMGFSWPV
jgi:hypothetical protein